MGKVALEEETAIEVARKFFALQKVKLKGRTKERDTKGHSWGYKNGKEKRDRQTHPDKTERQHLGAAKNRVGSTAANGGERREVWTCGVKDSVG